MPKEQNGPVYDNALKMVAATDLVGLCHRLGIEASAGSIRLAEELPSTPRRADLVAQIEGQYIAHVEFVRKPSKDLPQRMLEYRAGLMKRYSGWVIRQHVILLAGGRVQSQVTNGEELAMRLHVTYLRDHEPATFLDDPAVAPLALLGRARSQEARAAILHDVFEVVARVPDRERRVELADIAAVLAAIYLDPLIIKHVGKETGMPITLEGTHGGRILAARARAEGKAEGAVNVLTALLAQSFGDDPRIDEVAGRLAELPHADAVKAVLSARSLDELTASEA